MKNYKNLIINHYKKNWGDKFRECNWKEGPIHQLNNEFCVLEYPVGKKRKMWTYATCCMSSLDDNPKVEIHLFSPKKEEKHVELLTVIAHYHKTGNPLNLNHTINFGRPWFEKSNCSYGLISFPYLDGPELEILETKNILVSFLWLIPVTKNEVEYKKKYGIEKLEELFENKKFNYLDKYRKSVV